MEKNILTIPQLIVKKRNGQELSQGDIDVFVTAVVSGNVEGVQIGAMLMAMYQKDLSVSETTHLTNAMTKSGEVLQWPEEWNGLLVDKHSTGGVGDKISLVLAPALAACGLKVPMISGRGLGHTGGTLDKLESIPGYTVAIPTNQMTDILKDVGCCIVGQTANLCPADRILYKSRDITGTVDNIGLISASIVSKKAAENVNALVLDVKTGKGAFCETLKQSKILADRMVEAGNRMGIKTSAVITDMNYPIGRMIGNSLEVQEAVHSLQGRGPEDISELVEKLGGELLLSVGKAQSSEAGGELIRKTINDGSALEKFRLMCIAQGVNTQTASTLCNPNADIHTVLPKAKHTTDIKSTSTGMVTAIDAMACAVVAQSLGAGRTKFDDVLKNAVGLQLYVSVNSIVKQGETWITVHHEDPITDSHITTLQGAITVQSAHKSRILTVIQQ